MSSSESDQIRELFEAALDRPPEERVAFIHKSAASENVRQEVLSLLGYHEASGPLPATPETTSFPLTNDDIPTTPLDGPVELAIEVGDFTISGFEIIRTIATGGMGVVFEARQDHPRRAVAIKMMKFGLDSKNARKRFEYESQILALLEHPGIARIYAAGMHRHHEREIPYFVMEYIPNARSITAYADRQKLNTEQRIDLFIKVCEALQHGHQRRVIHRDVKPSNILVGDDGQPRVIDFGVARATGKNEGVTNYETSPGQLLGTLPYMAPEQVSGELDDLDIRVDVYALGVVLYELLYGQLPYDVETTSLLNAIETIRETDAHRPEASRRTSFDGDAWRITHKALAKDRRMRYQSAGELAQDLRRLLDGESIQARPFTLRYQIRLLARKQRPWFIAASVAFLALVAASIISSTFAVMASRAEAHAAHEAHKLAAVNSFLLEDLLGSANPAVARGEEITVQEVLDRAAATVDNVDDPELLALIHYHLGNLYYNLGRHDEGLDHALKSYQLRCSEFGEDSPEAAESLRLAAWCDVREGRYGEADQRLQSVIAIQKERLGPNHVELANSIRSLGECCYIRGDYPRALTLINQSLSILDRQPTQASSFRGLALKSRGRVFVAQGHIEEARADFEAALPLFKNELGTDHPWTLAIMSDVGNLLARIGELQEAGDYLKQVLEGRQRLMPEGNETIAQSMASLAHLYIQQGRFDDAVEYLDDAVDIYRSAFHQPHQYLATTQVARGLALKGANRLDEAVQAYEEAVDIYEHTVGPDHWLVANARSQLGDCLTAQGRPDEAKALLLAAYERLTQPDVDPRAARRTAERLATLFESLNQNEEMEHWRKLASPQEDVVTR